MDSSRSFCSTDLALMHATLTIHVDTRGRGPHRVPLSYWEVLGDDWRDTADDDMQLDTTDIAWQDARVD